MATHNYLRAQLPRFFLVVVALACRVGIELPAVGQTPATKSISNKFTEPPGQETDTIARLIDQAKTGLESGKSSSTILADPAFLAAHEWPRFRKLIRGAAEASPLAMVTPQEPGEALIVGARVVDAGGQPVKGAIVYMYQTSSKGWYSDRAAHVSGNEGDRKHARLFGYLKTNGDGRFECRTIRPGGYPDSNLPEHIHVEVERPSSSAASLITEIQFDDDKRLTPDWRTRSQQEGFVIGKVVTDVERRKRIDVELKMR